MELSLGDFDDGMAGKLKILGGGVQKMRKIFFTFLGTIFGYYLMWTLQ